MGNNFKPPILRKGKLIVVDLAGSERIHKSGATTTYELPLIILFKRAEISLCSSICSCLPVFVWLYLINIIGF